MTNIKGKKQQNKRAGSEGLYIFSLYYQVLLANNLNLSKIHTQR